MVQKRYKFIGCEVVYREACYLAATSPNHVDVQFLKKGLHDLHRGDMLSKLQATIDAIDPADRYEAILLGYARCNDGLAGLTARSIPLVIPRAHDCITFFFGSRRAYQRYFDEHSGTYYMTSGWFERNNFDQNQYARPAYGKQGVMDKLGLAGSREELIAKYGEENAEFILQSMGDWTRNYNTFLYLQMGVCDEREMIEETRREAAKRQFAFELRHGEMTLLKKLFEGPWDDDFVVVPPGQHIVARNDEAILDVAK